MKYSRAILFRLQAKYIGAILLVCAFLLASVQDCIAQTQLTFTGTPAVSGTPGAVNTTYTYNNVGTTGSTTIRAVIQITEKTGGASLYTIDASSGGAANAWQPVINGPSTSNGSCWGIRFSISFFDAATGFPLTLASFRANGIDIDGDGGTLREYNEAYNLKSYTVENPTSLTVTPVAGGGYHFRSPQAGYNGISLTQTNVAATWYYENIQSFTIRIGSCCVGGSCSATGSTNRQSSINFFDAVAYEVGTTVLPVTFISASARAVDHGNVISWVVSSQVNVSEYVVEKSIAPTGDFTKLRSIGAASGMDELKTYEMLDEQARGTSFYRIRAVDKDGAYTTSHVIRVTNNRGVNPLTVINDGRSRAVVFELTSQISEEVDVRLYDLSGRSLFRQVLRSRPGIHRYTLDKYHVPASGIYLVKISSASGIRASGKIVAF